MNVSVSAGDYQKLLPSGLPSWHMPYWNGLREHKILIQKCDQCGALRYAPKEVCPRCQHFGHSWQEVSGHGQVYTFTVIYRAPTRVYQAEVPYIIAHVQLDAGVRVVANLVDGDPETLQVGQEVDAIFDDVTPEWTLLRFKTS